MRDGAQPAEAARVLYEPRLQERARQVHTLRHSVPEVTVHVQSPQDGDDRVLSKTGQAGQPHH